MIKPYLRSMQAAIDQAHTVTIQALSAFGKDHPVIQQAADLEAALVAAAEAADAPPIPVVLPPRAIAPNVVLHCPPECPCRKAHAGTRIPV